jgi:prepilin-type N-terminal cleavage/methylation domain-containing protein
MTRAFSVSPSLRGELRRGFTMIELLVVISIIAILAAILFPVFAQARESARRSTCRANLHQIGMALNLYARDHDGRFPPSDNDLRPLVVPYVNGMTIFRCPSDGDEPSGQKESIEKANGGQGPVQQGPFRLPAGPLYISYQYRGGRTLEARGDTPLAADTKFLHADTASVVNLSGEVRSVKSGEWQPFAPDFRPATNEPPSQRDPHYTPFLAWRAGASGPLNPQPLGPGGLPLPATPPVGAPIPFAAGMGAAGGNGPR